MTFKINLKFDFATLLLVCFLLYSHKIFSDDELYRWIPAHRNQIHPYCLGHWFTWALFGNDDDGIYGERASPRFCRNEKNGPKKAFKWFFRNPLHNFCFYVIGSAHRRNSEFTVLRIAYNEPTESLRYRPESIHGFIGRRSTFFLAFHGGKPFLALRLVYTPLCKGEFYIGWRDRGNFGIKFRPFIRCKKKSRYAGSPSAAG